MQKHLEHILTRELSRKEFLTTIAYGLASLVGIITLHRVLSGSHHSNSSRGYGSSGYGR